MGDHNRGVLRALPDLVHLQHGHSKHFKPTRNFQGNTLRQAKMLGPKLSNTFCRSLLCPSLKQKQLFWVNEDEKFMTKPFGKALELIRYILDSCS